MLRIKHEPTTSEKVKATASSLTALAAAKAQQLTHEVQAKTTNDIAPAVAAKADAVKVATAPHVASAKVAAASQAGALKDAAAPHVDSAKSSTAAKASEIAAAAAAAKEAADERREEAAKAAEKQTKAARKKAKKSGKKLDKKAAKLDKKATKRFGIGKRQEAAYKTAALRGQAAAIAEDKGLTSDNVREMYQDEFLPHIKELLAAAAAAGVSARNEANKAAFTAFGNLPPEAQTQVAKVAPQLAKKQKKGGKGLILLGLSALGGAGYLFYTEQNKRKAANAQLSETAIADSQADRNDAMTINNPVTNFKHADDTTMVHPTAGEAGGPGTAATWEDTNKDGHITSQDLEGETRASRREGH